MLLSPPKIKVIVFDLDGVLIDSREMHYLSLNRALGSQYEINREEHLAKYDGHPTSYKLQLLTKEKGLPSSMHKEIWARKQELTQEVILDCYVRDDRICDIMAELKRRGYTLYCASNSIWKTIKNALMTKGFLRYIDYFVSNEDVRSPKPAPDIYFKCFEWGSVLPKEVLICEDSPIGRRAAKSSGAHLCPIEDVADVTLEKLVSYINKCDLENEYQYNMSGSLGGAREGSEEINIVIPCAGLGSRFAAAGYSFPKPLIDVNGKPMIQVVVENINIRGRFIFIVQKSHCEKYNMRYLLNAIAPGCAIIETDAVTEGAACSILLAKEYINNDAPLVTANSDQWLEWDARQFLYTSMAEGIDGCISTFKNSHPKYSYAKMNDTGYVVEVAEKRAISDDATTGIYFWRRGSDCVKYTEQMIAKDIRVNGEFYTCPVYNQAIEDNKKIKTVEAAAFWCLGTPEDLQHYLRLH